MPAQNSIGYEIIRRGDGVVALSVNANVLRFPPSFVQFDGEDALIKATKGPGLQVARLRKVPVDVRRRIAEAGKVHFFEFTRQGRYAPFLLELVQA